MKLIVGLGNPGNDYAGTRHNVGFMVLDRLARRHALGKMRNKFHATVLDGRIGGEKVMFLKPQTYMNRSGVAVGQASRFFKIPLEDVLVVVDDTALPLGAIRLRGSGSPGSHNGLADIHCAVGDGYARLRLGVGEPRHGEHPIPQADYVLSSFTDEQARALGPALDRAADAVECWTTHDLATAMNRYNTPRHASGESSAPKASADAPQATNPHP